MLEVQKAFYTMRSHTHTRAHGYEYSPSTEAAGVWLRTGDTNCGLSLDTEGGSGDACPFNHQPREPLAKKCIIVQLEHVCVC